MDLYIYTTLFINNLILYGCLLPFLPDDELLQIFPTPS